MADESPVIGDEQLDSGLRLAFAADADGPKTVLDQIHTGTKERPRIRLPNLGDPDNPPLEVQCTEIDIRGGYVGRIKLLQEIARGGVGVILEAWDRDLGRRVAVKVLREQHAGNYGLIQRFIEEAQIGAQLQHPGIVPVYELGLDDEHRPYFSMKLVEGTTLALLLKKRPFAAENQRSFLRIFEQVCQTISYAHARGVVHRDLKPGNVMVGSFGEVQVMDWGFAKVLGQDETPIESSPVATVRTEGDSESIVGSVFGTPNYMSPEQAQGMPIDARADVFALGAMLFEILVGRPPYVGDDVTNQAKRGDLDQALSSLASSGDGQLHELVRSCLDPDPANRPESAKELSKALAAHAEGREQRTREAEIHAAASKAQAREERRGRRRTQVLSVVLVVVILGLGWMFWNASMESQVLRQQILTELDDARETMDTGNLTAAHAIVMRAEGLAQTTDSLDTKVTSDIYQLRVRIEHRLRDSALEQALLRLRSRPSRENNLRDVYHATFRDYGVELSKPTDEVEAALRAKPCSIMPQVARALEDLARRLIRTGSSSASRYLDMANQIDPDPLRDEIRNGLKSGKRERLVAIIPKVDPSAPANVSHLLAAALASVHAIDEAIAVLEKAVLQHHQDLWLHYDLARHYRRHGTSAQHQKHLGIAKALYPTKDWDPFSRPPRGPRGRGGRGSGRGGRGGRQGLWDAALRSAERRLDAQEYERFIDAIIPVMANAPEHPHAQRLVRDAIREVGDGNEKLRDKLERLLR